jgi:NADP-dependent 3-hydroxy acid dehydrogenase YdfG
VTRGVAVVTGADSGIGRACAVALGEASWDVVLAGRRLDALEETAGLISSSGGPSVLSLATDVSDDRSVSALFEGVHERYGRVDLLFNNAGASLPTVCP